MLKGGKVWNSLVRDCGHMNVGTAVVVFVKPTALVQIRLAVSEDVEKRKASMTLIHILTMITI